MQELSVREVSMSDKDFNKYLKDHNLVVCSKELWNVLIDDHNKMKKLKELTAKYEPVEDKE